MKDLWRFDLGIKQLDGSVKRKTVLLVPANEDRKVDDVLPKILLIDDFIYLGGFASVALVPKLIAPGDVFQYDEDIKMYSNAADSHQCDENCHLNDTD